MKNPYASDANPWAVDRSYTASRTSSGLAPNSIGVFDPTTVASDSAAAIWAISPKSVRPPAVARWSSTASLTAPIRSNVVGWAGTCTPSSHNAMAKFGCRAAMTTCASSHTTCRTPGSFTAPASPRCAASSVASATSAADPSPAISPTTSCHG